MTVFWVWYGPCKQYIPQLGFIPNGAFSMMKTCGTCSYLVLGAFFLHVNSTFWTCVSIGFFTAVCNTCLPVYGQIWSQRFASCTKGKPTFVVRGRNTPTSNRYEKTWISAGFWICTNITTPTFSRRWWNKWKKGAVFIGVCTAACKQDCVWSIHVHQRSNSSSVRIRIFSSVRWKPLKMSSLLLIHSTVLLTTTNYELRSLVLLLLVSRCHWLLALSSELEVGWIRFRLKNKKNDFLDQNVHGLSTQVINSSSFQDCVGVARLWLT